MLWMQRSQLLPRQHQAGLRDQALWLLIVSAALFSEDTGCKLVVTEKSELLEMVEKPSPRSSLTTDGGVWLFAWESLWVRCRSDHRVCFSDGLHGLVRVCLFSLFPCSLFHTDLFTLSVPQTCVSVGFPEKDGYLCMLYLAVFFMAFILSGFVCLWQILSFCSVFHDPTPSSCCFSISLSLCLC